MSDIAHAVLLGIVEGLTEFLPVSSTGHLILVGHALDFTGGTSDVFNVFIQLGGIAAVLFLYPERFTGLLDFSKPGHGFLGRTALAKLALATLPALVAGFLCHGFIKSALFGPLPVAVGLIVGGVLLLVIERLFPRRTVERIEDISYRQCLVIGIFQCFSLWPGMSRSGSTIVGGIVCGLDRSVAAQFSFLAAVPIMSAAVTYDMYKSAALLSWSDAPVFAVGFIVSFFAAKVAIRFMVALLARYSLRPFGVYRLILGALVLWFVASYPAG